MKEVTIYQFQLETMIEALRITSNIHNSSQLITCHDRQVTQALEYGKNALNGEKDKTVKYGIKTIPPPPVDPRQKLFDHVMKAHDLTLLDGEMDEIIRICDEINPPELVDVTDEYIRQVFCKNVHFTGLAIKERIATVRHFMEVQRKGGEG